MKKTTIQDRILKLVKEQGPMTVRAIAHYYGENDDVSYGEYLHATQSLYINEYVDWQDDRVSQMLYIIWNHD